MATKEFPVTIGRSGEDASGQIPSLVRQAEYTYRTVLSNVSPTFDFDMGQFRSFSVQINNFGVSPTSVISVQGSNDGKAWAVLPGMRVVATVDQIAPLVGASFNASNNGLVTVAANKSTRFVRIGLSGNLVFNAATVHLSAAPIRIDDNPLNYPDAAFTFASPANGSTTSPVAIVAGGSPAFRRNLTAIQLKNAGTGNTEYAIQDGASGSILYRSHIGAGESQVLKFDKPLRGSGGNGLQLVLSSTTGIILYVNAHGFSTLA